MPFRARRSRVSALLTTSINNAGGQFQAHPLNISDNGWRAVIDLNLNGTWNVCSRFMRHMMERQTGSIVNVAHVFSFERGAPMFAHSGAARAGVVNLTRSLAPYLEQRNVTINVLAPGTTISPEAAANYGMTVEEWRAQPSRARYADPEDMAAIVLFMCSPAARMLNGAVIVADAASTQFNWPARSTEDLFDEVQASFEGVAQPVGGGLHFRSPRRRARRRAGSSMTPLSRLKVMTARRSGV